MVRQAVKDRAGRTVVLTDKGLAHIARRHPILDGYDLAIMRAVEIADRTSRGNAPNREVHWASDIGPLKWLAVVVSYDSRAMRGVIVTAWPSRKGPTNDKVL